ncbi:MAG TPA: hypothetical protein PLU47_07990 [Azonexus sp.]|nr:hypothetical protein [Azonexus sp.]
MPKRSSTGRLDLNQLAKLIVDEATDDAPTIEQKPEKNKAAQELGRLGGLKGGAARAKKLTAEERSEIAKKAAAARWKKSPSKQ